MQKGCKSSVAFSFDYYSLIHIIMMVNLFVGSTLTFYDKGEFYEIPHADAQTLICSVAPIFRNLRDNNYLGLRLLMPKKDSDKYFPIIVRKGFKVKIKES